MDFYFPNTGQNYLNNGQSFHENVTNITTPRGAELNCDVFTKLEQQSRRQKRKRRHVPHSQRPEEFVTKRNERERNRIHAVNDAFLELKNRLPQTDLLDTKDKINLAKDNKSKQISKVQILKDAIEYIWWLSDELGTADSKECDDVSHAGTSYSAQETSFKFTQCVRGSSPFPTYGERNGETEVHRDISNYAFGGESADIGNGLYDTKSGFIGNAGSSPGMLSGPYPMPCSDRTEMTFAALRDAMPTTTTTDDVFCVL